MMQIPNLSYLHTDWPVNFENKKRTKRTQKKYVTYIKKSKNVQKNVHNKNT